VILSIDLRNITYWIGRATIVPREDIPGMRVWPESIFAFLQRNAER
jgi:KUP system potassium uptake protein